MADETKVTAASQADDRAAQQKARAADEKLSERAAAAAEKREEKLNALAELAPAERMSSSGAIIEEDVIQGVDYDHPAVDNNPRAGTTVRQNAIDFNDPTLSSEEAVEANLEAQKA